MQQCSRCSFKGPPDVFPFKKNGTGRLKTCAHCTSKTDSLNAEARRRGKATRQSINKDSDKENSSPSRPVHPEQGNPPTKAVCGRLPELPLVEVLALLEAHKQDGFSIDCIAVIDEEAGEEIEVGYFDMELGARAHAIARSVRDTIGWKFK